MTTTESIPRRDGLIPVEILDWRAGRTWAVFLYIALGYGSAVGALVIGVKLLILSLSGHLDVEKMESMRFAFSIVSIMAVAVLVGRYAKNNPSKVDLSGPRARETRLSKIRKSLWEGFLVLLWIGLTLGLVYSLHSAFFAIFDLGSKAQLPMGFLMSFTVVIGTLLLRPFLMRWGQTISSGDC